MVSLKKSDSSHASPAHLWHFSSLSFRTSTKCWKLEPWEYLRNGVPNGDHHFFLFPGQLELFAVELVSLVRDHPFVDVVFGEFHQSDVFSLFYGFERIGSGEVDDAWG